MTNVELLFLPTTPVSGDGCRFTLTIWWTALYCSAQAFYVKVLVDSGDVGGLAAPVNHDYIQNNGFPHANVAPYSSMLGMRYRGLVKKTFSRVSFYVMNS